MEIQWFECSGWSLPLWFWYGQGLMTPLIGVIAAYIALRQWKTSAYKVKLDLFDRRFKVYVRVREMLALIATRGDANNDDQLRELWRDTREAEFLFEKDIKDYIDEIYERGTSMYGVYTQVGAVLEAATPTDRQKRLAGLQGERAEWATEQSRVVAQRFTRYLNLSKL